ncbi:MAG: hypothetical protein M3552_14140 [Planctomycetota bacterium]|nr:hypothetical protein [Planctomycetota bacterium]
MITELNPTGTGRVRSKQTEKNEPDGNGGWRKLQCRRAEVSFDGQTAHLDFEKHPEAFDKLVENGFVKVKVRASTKTFDGKTSTRYELLEAEAVAEGGARLRAAA